MRLRPILALAVAGPLLLGHAISQSNDEAIRLEYRAPQSCEDEKRFFALARSRAPRMRLARPDERVRVFIVEIEQRPTGTWGRLTIRDPNGQRTVREIEAKDCSEAVDALALVAALAVNPRAGTETKEAPPAVSAQPAAPTSSAAPVPSPTRPPEPVPAPARPAEPAEPTPAPEARETPGWAWRGGVAGLAMSGIAPEPLVGGRISAEVVNFSSQWIAPSFRISLAYATREGFVVEGGTAHFAYLGGNLEICPLRVPRSGPVAFRPCVTSDLGLVLARGTDTIEGRSPSQRWADVGAGGRLEWMLSRYIGLELDVQGLVPLWRDRFLFGTLPVHRVSWLGGLAALGLTVRIP